MSKVIRILMVGLLVVVCTLAVADSAFAQCALCRASVTQAFAKNLNLAILVLFVPPVSIFATIFLIAFRKRKG